MKRLISLIFSVLLAVLVLPVYALNNVSYPEENAQNNVAIKAIGISQIVQHPALDAVHKKLLEALKEEGFVEGKNLKVMYENAQGNLVTSTQVATKLVSNPLDVIVGISTPSAQTVLNAAKHGKKKIPIVFAAVSDPKIAQLEPSQVDYP